MRVRRREVILGVLLSLTLGSFCSSAVFATNNVSISISDNIATMNLLPGQFDTDTQTITASTTSTAGYTIGLRTTGKSSSLVHTNNSNYTIPTFTLPSGSESIPVGNLGPGYGYSIDSGANYKPVPEPTALNTTTLFKTTSAGSHTHNLTFGVKAPTDAVAGIYENTFSIGIVANLEPCDAEKICYYGNNDDGNGVMLDQSAASNSDVTLIPSNFSRPGYGFKGWNTAIDGSGTNYGPNQTITVGDLTNEGLQLYAMWVPSAGDLQEWRGCDSMSQGDVTALTDTRDGNTYAVAKYADDKCWMMENLRLDLSDTNVVINNSNTNKPTSSFVTAANAHPASSNSFCTGTNSGCVTRIYHNTNNINRNLTPAYDTNDSSSSWYSYGVYYNYYTATAGNGGYSFATGGATVNGDICPAGWKLPTAYTRNDELAKLDLAYDGTGNNQTTEPTGSAASARWRSYPLNFIYSGEQNGTSGYNRGISAGMNTASNSSAARSINLWVRSNAVSMVNNSTAKSRGQTIRCVAKGTSNIKGDIHYEANEGTGTMADEENVNFASAIAANNQFVKTNYEFVNWNTSANGSGITIPEGGALEEAAVQLGLTSGDTLTLYAIWRPVYRIIYAGNGADAGSMASATQEQSTSNFKLWAPNYSKDDYGFLGWSADSTAATKLINHQNVTIYGPSQNMKLDNEFISNADANNQITLYAVWLAEDTTDTLQSFSSNRCGNMNTGDVLALSDERDSETYTVAKLADGNCWITENLRLDPSTTTFTTTNTNSPTTAFINDTPTSQSATTLCNTDNSACVDRILFNANNLDRTLTASPSTNNNASSWYGYGIMYGWYTATAGNGDFEMSSGNVTGDICPAGWRLPTGDTSGEYVSLVNALTGSSAAETNNNLLAFPNNFVYSGDYNYNTSGGRGTYGRYWSATPNGKTKAFRLGISIADGATPAGSWNKWDAFAVRCILR